MMWGGHGLRNVVVWKRELWIVYKHGRFSCCQTYSAFHGLGHQQAPFQHSEIDVLSHTVFLVSFTYVVASGPALPLPRLPVLSFRPSSQVLVPFGGTLSPVSWLASIILRLHVHCLSQFKLFCFHLMHLFGTVSYVAFSGWSKWRDLNALDAATTQFCFDSADTTIFGKHK